VVIGDVGEEKTFADGKPAILRNVYGGGEGGSVFGTTHLTINNGMIGYRWKNTGTESSPVYTYVEELDDKAADDNLLDGSGNISGSVKIGYGGAFDLEGKFSLTDKGKEMFHEAAPNFYVYGGNDKDTANDLWDIVMGKKLDDRTRWSNTLRNWVNSMYTTDDRKPIMSKAAPMSFYLEPIWTLFDDPAIQKYAQDYFIKKYEDRGIKGYLSIALNLANATADDLFDADSDFWKKSKLRQIPQISKASDNYNKSEDK
jgi:hypothetical protein